MAYRHPAAIQQRLQRCGPVTTAPGSTSRTWNLTSEVYAIIPPTDQELAAGAKREVVLGDPLVT
jgi:hypothetical protein